ncbi:MAG: sporulation initiation factor Spo0A C-terminal domain-containing protein [Clostridiales bacterium]|nr:sporulation initiation factor Spo0A C-terminal domain-containing protein [Clostridiales bacterium]
MKKRDFIIITLVKVGFRTSLKGFDQFCMCLELYSEDPTRTIGSIYERIACSFNCTVSSVEKNLRRLFMSSNATTAISRLFGMEFCDTGNKEIVSMFSNYVSLQRECYSQ